MAKKEEQVAAARRAEANVFNTQGGKSYLENMRAMTLNDRTARILNELEAEAKERARTRRK